MRGLSPDNEYMVTNDTETVEDAAKKHLYTMPEYVLNIMQPKTGAEKLPLRVITFHRDDLLPSDQTIYDSQGTPETLIDYSNYTDYSAGRYPSKVTIRRPKEGIQIVLEVVRVEKNVDIPLSQFDVKIPEGIKDQEPEIAQGRTLTCAPGCVSCYRPAQAASEKSA